ncbi:hypothetical protein [Terribacillus sp. 7520-G]|uniref:hypothetical protein n=1 Tax=Terribacillus TaxID=459532 RepID=UPI000BA7265C|nr:hypothetical protein [Terribacillus sp. 7520-G]PAD38597.1 hypothetical protein CHH53_10220 [Terribacillus sp. 7520-G]
MITRQYKERVAKDLFDRITKVQLNGEEVEMVSKELEGTKVTILTGRREGVTRINSIRILDELGLVITERSSQLDVKDNRTLDFRFSFEVV